MSLSIKAMNGMIAAILCASPLMAEGEETSTVGDAVAAYESAIKSRCETLTPIVELLGNTRSVNADTIRSQHAIVCQCMPKKLAAVRASYPSDARVTQAEFVGTMQTALNNCGADNFRKYYATQCDSAANKEVSASERRRYCSCASEKLAAMPDEAIINAQEKASREFDAKVAAQKSGAPAPSFEPSVIAMTLSSCKAAK